MANGSKDELRVVIVLGIIGVLFSASQLWPEVTFAYNMTLRQVLNLLILYWGGYLILLAIGISDDWVKTSVAKVCYESSIMLFMIGMGFVTAMALVAFLTPHVGGTLAFVFGIADLLVFMIVLSKKRPNVWKQVFGVPTDDVIFVESLGIDCPSCGAKVGDRCKGKHICPERGKRGEAIALFNIRKSKENRL